MNLFSEYKTGTIDLSLIFYGFEECLPGYSFGPAIRETYVLHYISKGKGCFHYKGEVIPLTAGDLFLLKPDELTFYQADEEDPWSYYWLGISGSKAGDYFAHSQIDDLSYLKHSDTCHTQTTADLIKNIVEFAQVTKFKELAQLHLLGQLHELMFHLGRIAYKDIQEEMSPSQELYLDCKQIIETQYPTHLTIQDIAQKLNVHRSYLTTIFKEFHDQSPKEYLLYVRMHRAKQLLEATSEPIKFIAYSVGFTDALHFSKSFKQFWNCSPSDFRKTKNKKR